jgi:non-specific serine/threonine protein kinase
VVHFHEECTRSSRDELGEERFDAAFRSGRNMPLPAAIAYALGEGGEPVRPTPRPVASQAILTPREREVADLIARGASNKDIAAHLVISRRTAETHVEHILAKLGFTSRSQVAAWVGGNDDHG